MSGKVNLTEAFASFDELWQPRAAADVDGYQLKIAKIEGEFVWHAHDDADELFLVHAGHLTLRLRENDDVELEPGELYVVPRGVEHQPVGRDGCEIVMFERAEVVNTGNAGGERTAAVRPLGR